MMNISKGSIGGILLALILILLLFNWWQPTALKTVYFRLCKSYVIERDITYGTIADVDLKMDVYCCQNTGVPRPAVIYIHGGGWYSGDKSYALKRHDIPELLDQGYLVAAIDYRLAPRYKFPAQIEDVKCAIRFLRANADTYGIDPLSIGLLGDSAGGHLAALAGVYDNGTGFGISGGNREQADKVQAVVDIYGPTDLALICQQDNTLHMEHVFGTADPSSPIIKQASPVTHVSSDDPPFLILHGDQDKDVSLEQSRILYQRLSTAGVSADLVMVNNCGHRFTPVDGVAGLTHNEITNIIVSFFDKHLKNSASTVNN